MPVITRSRRVAYGEVIPMEDQPAIGPLLQDPSNMEILPEYPEVDNGAHMNVRPSDTPTPPQMCWAQRAHPPVNVDQALETAQSILTTLEATWSLNGPSLENCWENASDHEGLEQEVTSIWCPDGLLATNIVLSKHHQVLLILNVLRTGTEFRYVTPHHVWAHTMCHDGSHLIAVDPEPSPISSLPVLMGAFVRSPSTTAHAEMRLQIQHCLSNASGLQTRHSYKIDGAKCTYSKNADTALKTSYRFSSINSATTCPGCKTDEDHESGPCISKLDVVADRWFRTIRITCQRSKTNKIIDIGHSPLYLYLFELGTGHRAHASPTPVRAPPGFADSELVLDDVIDLAQHRPTQTAGIPALMPEDLTIVSYNTDGSSRLRLGEILSFGRETSADVILLQDVNGANWASQAVLSQGWTIYSHGAVAILLKIATAEAHITVTLTGKPKPPKIWRSTNYRSMAITLDTKKGPMLISNAYIPPGVDKMTRSPTNPKWMAVVNQHTEIAKLAMPYKYGVLGMDANETTSRQARVQNRPDDSTDFSGTTHGTGIGRSSMAAYEGHMVDASFATALASGCLPRAYPRKRDITHSQPGNTENLTSVDSTIDYFLATTNLTPLIKSCRVDNRTKF
jgi:exonuclease III